MNHRRITPREREVLDYRRTGLQLKEIAERLRISPKTVDAHLCSIRAKTGLVLVGRPRTWDDLFDPGGCV